jgi:hypothetical protein
MWILRIQRFKCFAVIASVGEDRGDCRAGGKFPAILFSADNAGASDTG